MKTIGYFNELKRAEDQRLAEAADRGDAIIGGVCLVLCLAYAVARYLGVIA